MTPPKKKKNDNAVRLGQLRVKKLGPDAHRALCRVAGKASGVARRKKALDPGTSGS